MRTTPKGHLLIPASRLAQFRHTDKNLRWGQAFYLFMELGKCVQDRDFCDKLFNAPDDVAKNLVRLHIDTSN